MEKGNFFLSLTNLILFSVLLYKACHYQNKLSKRNTKITIHIFFLSLIFCLFAFWGGDYFHLLEDYKNMRMDSPSNLEVIYITLAKISPFYICFRFLIWGTMLYFVMYIEKRLNTLGISKEFVFYFSAICLLLFSYARVSLSMSIIVFCVISILQKKNSFVMVCLLLCSPFLHKSALFGVIAAIISLSLYKYRIKYLIIPVLLLIPICIGFVSEQISMLLMMDPGDGGMLNFYSGRDYFDQELFEGSYEGIGIRIANYLNRSILYIATIHYIYISIKKKSLIYEQMPKEINAMGIMLTFVVVSATIIYTSLGPFLYIVYYRLLNFALLPCAIYLSYIHYTCNKSFFVKFFRTLVILASLYFLSYSTYNIL